MDSNPNLSDPPDVVSDIEAVAAAVRATPPADDPLTVAARVLAERLAASLALVAVEGRGALTVVSNVVGPQELVGEQWPIRNFEDVVWRLDTIPGGLPVASEVYLLRVGDQGSLERSVLVLGWTARSPERAVLRLAARVVAAEREAHQSRRLTRCSKQAIAWSSRLASGAPCRLDDVSSDFLEVLLSLVPFESGSVWMCDRTGARRRLATVGGSPHGPVDDGPLVELAVSTGRPHWFDAAQGAADHAVVVVPFSTRCGPAVLVVRSYEPGRRVFSHDVEVVVATARELSIVVDLVEAAETERTMSDPLDVLAELSAAPPASDAEYLDCVASRVFARRWADVVFVVTGDSRSCTGTYLTADGLRGEWSTSGHSLIEETAEGPVAVSRVSGLRAAEEEMLSAIDIRSYVVSRVGDDTALGIGSTKEDAYDEAAGESFRAMTAAIRVLRTAGRAESKARVVEGQLDRFGRVHQRLMTAIGHQFRTPLTSITGFTRTLVNPDLADMVGEGESRDFLNIIARQAGRLGRTVENFQLASELQLGSWRPVESDVDVDDLVLTVVEELSNASALDEPIVVVAEAGRLPTDPAAVQAIVANLLDNAIRFGGPPVEVTVRRSGRDLSVSVADHGSGLTEHERQEAVNPWVGSDADEANPSVGLGLSLVSELATRLGGDISLRETPGGGLTVEVRLSTRSGPLGP